MWFLEMEKSKLKSELGSRKSSQISEECDESTLWETLSILSSTVKYSPPHVSLEEGKTSSHRAFESWARGQISSLNTMLKETKVELKHLDEFQGL